MEWKLFDGNASEFATSEWYKGRQAAHHLEEDTHKERLHAAASLVNVAIGMGAKTAVDLGCGDGGLLQLLKNSGIKVWGYDLLQANVDYAVQVRNVDARYTDFVSDDIEYGDVAILTETLEHMIEPHKVVRELPSKFIVASSPYNESNINHYEFHLWAWDQQGYNNLITQGGYRIVNKLYVAGWSQVLLGVRDE
jgi:2-polyprenyl-3-methyl-5-hydroxy-6-metoxy-1,4-benzoquinol methylase